MIRQHNAGIYTALLMWSPALAATLVLRLGGEPLAQLRASRASVRWMLIAWALTAATMTLVHVPVYVGRLVPFPDAAAVRDRAAALGIPNAPTAVVVIVLFIVVATSSMVRLAGPAFGEELGWRGLLTQSSCRRLGYIRGSLLVGAVWSTWHFPLMLGRVPIAGVVNFTIMIMGMAFAYSWLCLKSDSVWPTTVAHAVHNALVSSFFVKLAAPGPAANSWLDETGYTMALYGLLLAFAGVLSHRRWPALEAQSIQPLRTQ